MSKNEKNMWSRDETWSLINCLEVNEILWNFTIKDYQNKVKKETVFEEVARIIKTKSVGEIKKKIHALRSQHCGERIKMKKKSGSSTDDTYKSKWEFFTALNFMFKDAGSAGPVVDSMENVNHETDDDFAAPELKIPAKPIKLKKNREKEDPRLELAYSILEAPIEKEDSTTLFGKYVSEKLNQFEPYTKALLTHKINNLIFEAEMSTIDNPHSKNVTSSPSFEPSLSLSILPQNSPANTSVVYDLVTEY